ncbi:MAG TPA: M14 family zinc carboxypeptidase [Gemmatimonadaceae bacterium]
MSNIRQLAGAALIGAVSAFVPLHSASAQANDAEYTAKIRELTSTDPKWKFTTELVDHLPASKSVPTPLKGLGYVPGSPGHLSHVAEINNYFRSVERASPRVKVFSLGKSEEGREMIVAAVADENTIKHLDEYRQMLGKLADPRGLSATERARLIKEAKPIYWLSGSIHSPETGSPEMLTELLYRMAVEETPFIRSIRNNTITLITPQTEVDGRDREVDVFNYRVTDSVTIPLAYWGQYTAHDNNRDAIGMSAKLTRNMLAGFLNWHPTVVHDLHESVPFMYIMTGTGPYNDEFDPIVVNEWHTLAYNEMNEMAKREMPGVWTHGFYDGWAPNYMLAMVNLHNSIGRFYETMSATGPGGNGCMTTTFTPGSQVEKEWDRFNPPVPGVKWCFRNNINYQQSGVLFGMKYVADHKETFLDDFVAKAERLIKRGRTEAPYAYVIPHDQKRAQQAADLVNYFRMQGAEIQVASQDFTTRVEPQIMGRQGSALLAQNIARVRAGGISTGVLASTGRGGRGGGRGFDAGDPTVAQAGDVGGAAAASAAGRGGRGGRGGGGRGGAGRGATPDSGATRAPTRATTDSAGSTPTKPADPIGKPATVHAGDWIIRMDQPYTQTVRTILAYQHFKPADDPPPYDDIGWTLDELYNVQTLKVVDSTILSKPMKMATADAKVAGTVAGTGRFLLVPHLGDWRSAALPWKLKGAKVSVADSSFSAKGQTFAAGTFIVDGGNAAGVVADLGLKATAVDSMPKVTAHAVSVPRVAYIHTWNNTQDEGWVRYAFDYMGIPYTYMADQKLADTKILDNYDVVIFPSAGTSSAALLAAKPVTGKPIPWKRSAKTPNLGTPDSTDDTRGSMGLEGVMALERFIARGGLFITEGATARLPLDLGFTFGAVSVAPADSLWARGSVFRAQVVDKTSPIAYGYDQDNLSVYYKQGAALFNLGAGGAGGPGGGRGGFGGGAAQAPAARIILRMNSNIDSLLVSGGMLHGEEMAGKGAVVDVPLGKGNIVMFGIRPMWRFETHGSFALVLNAMANWNALGKQP